MTTAGVFDPFAAAAEEAAPAAIAGTAPAAVAGGAVDWQRLWLAAQRRAWTSLALVPIGDGVSTPRLAAALADVGRQHLGGVLVVRDATAVSLGTLEAQLAEIAERARCAERAIVALPPLLDSPAGLALARAADAVIVCITLGSSAIAEAERILDEVGRDRVIGSVIIKERKEKP